MSAGQRDRVHPTDEPLPGPPRSRRRLWLALKVALSVAILALVIGRNDPSALWDALRRVSARAVGVSAALITLTAVIGAARWAAVMRAYGAPHLPSAGRLLRLYFMGFFYNLWLPGGVGGDLVRGVASREAFGDAGATAGLTVVFVERLCGLIGLFLFVGVSFSLWPLPGVDVPVVYAAMALALAASGVALVALAPALTPVLPPPLARITARVPRLVRREPFILALGLSTLTHLFTALSGHVLVAALAPNVSATHSLTVVSLAAVSAFFPLTHAGAGIREGAFVQLYAPLGVPGASAVAASLGLFATQLLVSGAGALVSVLAGGAQAPIPEPSTPTIGAAGPPPTPTDPAGPTQQGEAP
ncbi:MAG: lysylphosphatidylglycerol synthase transmembrane domain-containing protein [Polyangiales bacterium]|nr:flippase-like domain-containing protein [Myxococcales bacterium]